jgi:tetratricopeptide (TPR) repeat protein
MSDTTILDPDERAQLEHERDFLLRSLDDLDRERDKGAIDDESYARLHDDYTARAAAVIRTLRDGVDVRPIAPPISRRRRVLTILGIVAFAVVVALALAAALGARLPGQTSSGNTGGSAAPGGSSTAKGGSGSGTLSVAQRIQRLKDSLADNPDDLATRLLLARFLEADGDLAGALQQYDEVLARNPASAEAQAQAGRILYLTARAAVKPNPDAVDGLIQQAMARLDQAITVDPSYPDARYFRAIVEANEFGAFAVAQNDLQRYLILAPQGQFGAQARQLLAQVTGILDGTPPSTATTPTTRAKR